MAEQKQNSKQPVSQQPVQQVSNVEQTLVLVKPDGVYRGVIGNIITRFENAGLKLVAASMKWVDKDFTKKHYNEHLNKAFYPSLEQYLTAGPVMAMVWEGIDVISVVRKIVGATEPKEALPGTIRGDFCHISKARANAMGKSVCNLIHASANVQDAIREIGLWFDIDDIHTYKRAGEEWLI
ncbi:Nucleoside diphosphate kinase [Candidatus Tiddalikarchaeum anstoanum]|nr:Nucleoside diphosphate kinase [Candidatus Tiddalikarchaeum anstoanum]